MLLVVFLLQRQRAVRVAWWWCVEWWSLLTFFRSVYFAEPHNDPYQPYNLYIKYSTIFQFWSWNYHQVAKTRHFRQHKKVPDDDQKEAIWLDVFCVLHGAVSFLPVNLRSRSLMSELKMNWWLNSFKLSNYSNFFAEFPKILLCKI